MRPQHGLVVWPLASYLLVGFMQSCWPPQTRVSTAFKILDVMIWRALCILFLLCFSLSLGPWPTSSTRQIYSFFYNFLSSQAWAPQLLRSLSLLSLLLVPSVSVSPMRRTWLNIDFAVREFAREWRCSSRLSCLLRPHHPCWPRRSSCIRALARPSPVHPPHPTRLSLRALLLGRVYVVGTAAWVLDLLPQINKELVSSGDREWCYVGWYVFYLSLLPSCSPLLLSPCLCCLF